MLLTENDPHFSHIRQCKVFNAADEDFKEDFVRNAQETGSEWSQSNGSASTFVGFLQTIPEELG
jgi:hypothetical protein